MAVGFRVGNIIDEVGSTDFLHAFFSTISGRLEPRGWGSRFPELMNELYQGRLGSAKAQKVLMDLATIRAELKRFQPKDVIWDIEKPEGRPPWGDKISSDITDLSNYFVTSTGRDMFEVLDECLLALKVKGGEMTIENY
jgi:hypothetical protein